MGRKKKIVEEVKEEVVVAPVEEIKEEEPKEEIKVEEPKTEKEEMIDVPPMPETFDAKKKEYNVRDVIRQYIGCETARIFEGNLTFDSSLALENNRYNVVIGNFDISKFIANNPPLPKVIFGNLIINKNANVGNPEFLGGKKIKK